MELEQKKKRYKCVRCGMKRCPTKTQLICRFCLEKRRMEIEAKKKIQKIETKKKIQKIEAKKKIQKIDNLIALNTAYQIENRQKKYFKDNGLEILKIQKNRNLIYKAESSAKNYFISKGINYKEVPKEIFEAKVEQLKLLHAIKELKEEVNNGDD